MTLAKKTVILSKNGAKGYITIVRVGSSTGIKYVLDIDSARFAMGLKIGYNPLIVKELEKTKGEFSLDDGYNFKNTDDVSCMVISGNNVLAEGGLRGRIQLQDVIYKVNLLKTKINENDNSRVENVVNNKNIKNKNKMEAVNGIQEKSQRSYTKNQERNIPYGDKGKTTVQEPASRKLKESDNKDTQEENKKSIEFSIPKDMKGFYYSVKDKLDELFVMYPRDEQLEKIIPCSKWVRINYDKDDFYVAGVLLDENKVTHIAYGVPGFEGMTPPKETECICDWLPMKNMEKYQGYWLIFQSADTGEILPKD
ncbi:MAG: hypothetical protein ACOCWI_01075 [Bacillota bacterium]